MYEEKGYDYMINSNFSESDFNEIERKNIELIRSTLRIDKCDSSR